MSTGLSPLRLGLIGDQIAASRAPELHRKAGRLLGRPTVYDRLVPAERGMDLAELVGWAAASGYAGLNVTYPYKGAAAALAQIDDPAVARIGAVNTLLLGQGRPRGFNTDHSGFIAAYRGRRGATLPGAVALIGAGGAGRAVGFGLLSLGAERIVVTDVDSDRAHALAADLRTAAEGRVEIRVSDPSDTADTDVDGLVNCTPLGMDGDQRLPVATIGRAVWAFDAVYTPVWTPFLRMAKAAGLDIVPGVDLFLHQGLDAVALFHGVSVDPDALRHALGDLSD